ncbi:MAG: type II secretion system F family protein [Candidatus Heimdallarchaeota archaeon]|nr:MAG: type II secretion system F family protein [Candidatus Heimdallarchaeota archaeon]
MGKLTQKREQLMWILSSILFLSALIIALLVFYIPTLTHIESKTGDIEVIREDIEKLTEDKLHPFLYSVNDVSSLSDINPLLGFFDILDMTLVTVLALLILPAWAYNSDRKWRDNIEDHIPSLLREISDAQKTGLPLPRAILEASKHQYGALTPELKKMAAKISWGIPFSKTLRSLTEVADTPLMKRTSLLILEAERSGGAIEDVFESAHTHVSEILGLKRERLTAMKPYTWIIYASFIIFSLVIIILLLTFFQRLAVQIVDAVRQDQEPQSGLPFNVAGLQLVFFHMMMIEAVFAGLIAGKMGEGDAKIGLRHSCILLMICYVFFKITIFVFPIVPNI